MSTSQDRELSWETVPTRTITAGGVEFAYRQLGSDNPGPPVVFLVHLAAVMDNWRPKSRRRLRRQASCSSSTRTSCPRRLHSLHVRSSEPRLLETNPDKQL
jgi:pimeloyl-ACP methyl ester carboxylesterase